LQQAVSYHSSGWSISVSADPRKCEHSKLIISNDFRDFLVAQFDGRLNIPPSCSTARNINPDNG
jgi:hypothetical protein